MVNDTLERRCGVRDQDSKGGRLLSASDGARRRDRDGEIICSRLVRVSAGNTDCTKRKTWLALRTAALEAGMLA